mgnify:CR=1 FL=1|tara:strand:- start:2346 stop:2714 length:369 start_codon:yes stop_codon:yes gene_type:complete
MGEISRTYKQKICPSRCDFEGLRSCVTGDLWSAAIIFVNTLGKEIPKYAPGIDARFIANAGATNLRKVVPADLLPGVLEGYNRSIITAFVLAIATSAIAFFVSLGMEQKGVKGKKIELGGAA